MDELASNDHKTAVPRWIWLGCILMVVVAALHSANRVVGGGDTWVAMECGRYTLGPWAEKQTDRTWQMRLLDKFGIHITKRDPYSAASRPFVPGSKEDFGWVNQNWLTHVMFYKMKSAGGADDMEISHGEVYIVYYKFLQAILTALFAYWAARVLGAHPLLAAAAASFGILLSRSFVDLRPNVATIFLSAIMIFLLSCWEKHRTRTLLWMIPVMIIWSNVHGGFIYPIMIFWIMAGGYLVMKWFGGARPRSFPQISWREYLWLGIGAVVVTLIPGIFSPFGWENLIHPLVIATGEEGRIWRDVIEWKPIWDTSGFGNATPYVIFLVIFGLVFLLRWVIFLFLKPKPEFYGKKKKRRIEPDIPWPKINLAHLGVVGITILMSVKSRRFIFLGGVVLAPYLALLIQETIDMIRVITLRKNHQPLELAPMPRRPALIGAGLSVLAVILMSLIYGFAMYDIYVRPVPTDDEYTLFRRMVGIDDQPVRAIKFFDANNVQGVVFNEWTNGGFVAFHQKPDPETGEPACKVFMDGRSQAAYHVSHFTYWRTLRVVPDLGDPDIRERVKKDYPTIKQIAQRKGVSPTDPGFFDEILSDAENLDREKFPNQQAYEKERTQKRAIIHYALSEPKLMENILKRDKLTVALLSLSKSIPLYNLFNRMANWKLLYIDDKNAIFFRTDAPENRELLQKKPEELIYPDEFSRTYSLAMINCHRGTLSDVREGVKKLMQIEKFVPPIPAIGSKSKILGIHDFIYGYGVQLGMQNELLEYFDARLKKFKDRVARNEQFSRMRNLQAVISSYTMLARLTETTSPGQSRKYIDDMKPYQAMQQELADELEGRKNILWLFRKGWFW